MPHPKKRRTTSDKGKRRSHHALKGVLTSVCKKCGAAVKPHCACPKCGFYNGRDVLAKKVEAKKEEAPKKTVKKEKKVVEKAEKKVAETAKKESK